MIAVPTLRKYGMHLLRLSWLLAATFIIGVAVLVALVRVALPEVHRYHQDIEDWLGEYSGYAVQFDSVEAEWLDWSPKLTFAHLYLFVQQAAQGTPPPQAALGHFDALQISLDPVQSLLRLALVPDAIDIDGLRLHVVLDRQGTWRLYGDTPSDTYAEELASWLLRQPALHLRDMQIHFTDELLAIDALRFDAVDVDLSGTQDGIRVEAHGTLPPGYGDSLEVRADVTGDLLSPDWDGRLYARWNKPEWRPPGDDAAAGFRQQAGSLRAWSYWQAATLQTATVAVTSDALRIIGEGTEFAIQSMELAVDAKRRPADAWQFDVRVDELHTDAGQWPAARHQLVISPDESGGHRYAGTLEYLNIHDASSVLRLHPRAQQFVPGFLRPYHIAGTLQHLNFTWDTVSPLAFDASFSSLALSDEASGNRVHGLNGQLHHPSDGPTTLRLLCGDEVAIELPQVFADTRRLSCLRGDIAWQGGGDVMRWQLDSLEALGDDYSASATGSIDIPEDVEETRLDLQATVRTLPLEKLSAWLPVSLEPGFRSWMAEALPAGQLDYADVDVQGTLRDLPYETAPGRFQANMSVTDATVAYAPQWPILEQLDARVTIDNQRVTVESFGGRLYDARIRDGTRLHIDNVVAPAPQAHIAGTFSGDMDDARLFIRNTPLGKEPGLAELAQADISGALDIELDLLVPLSEQPNTVRGRARVTDAVVGSGFAGLGLRDVRGNLRFDGTSVHSEALTATYNGHPVAIDINVVEDRQAQYTLRGRVDRKFLIAQLLSFYPDAPERINILPQLLDGEGTFRLGISEDGEDEHVRRVVLDTDMQGLSVALPAPLGKVAAARRPLSLATTLRGSKLGAWRVNYDDLLFAVLLIDNTQGPKLDGLSVGLGQEAEEIQAGVLQLRGELPELDAAGWWSFLSSMAARGARREATGLRSDLALTVNKLLLFNNHFEQISLHAASGQTVPRSAPCGEDVQGLITPLQAPGQWLALCGDGLQGLIHVPDDRQNAALRVALQRLNLNLAEQDAGPGAGQGATADQKFTPHSLPAVRLNVEQLTRAGQELGKLEIVANKRAGGLDFETVSLNQPAMLVVGNGQWIDGADGPSSSVDLILKAKQFSDMLEGFGYGAAGIRGGKTRLSLKASWGGSPVDFALEDIDGTLRLDIGKGSMLDVEPAIGRVFGLFSLGTLTRRLTLDFSDLFGKGLAFDSIEGDFSLQGGHARIDQLALSGPAANISMLGHIGLKDKNYDQTAVVTPQITKSIPWVASLLGPIGIGVGAAVYLDQQFTQALPNPLGGILEAEYRITGPWDTPKVVRVGRPRAEKARKNTREPIPGSL